MSLQFIDSRKRPWVISITIGAVARAKKLCEVDLAQPVPMMQQENDGKPDELPLLTKLGIDLELFGNVLYAIIEPQCREQNVSQEDFLDALDGDVLKTASDLFWKEYADFFQRVGRKPMTEAIQMQQDMIEKGMLQLSQMLSQIELGMDKKITDFVSEAEQEIGKISGNKSGTRQVPVG